MRTADVAERLRLGRRCQKCNKRMKSSSAGVLTRSGEASIPVAHNEPHTRTHSLQHPRCCSAAEKDEQKEGTRVTRDESGPRARPPAKAEATARATPPQHRLLRSPPSEADGDEMTRRLLLPASTSFCRGRAKRGYVSTIGARGHRGSESFFRLSVPVSQSRAGEHCTRRPSANTEQTECRPVDRKRGGTGSGENATDGAPATTKAWGRPRTELRRRRGRAVLQQPSRSVGARRQKAREDSPAS